DGDVHRYADLVRLHAGRVDDDVRRAQRDACGRRREEGVVAVGRESHCLLLWWGGCGAQRPGAGLKGTYTALTGKKRGEPRMSLASSARSRSRTPQPFSGRYHSSDDLSGLSLPQADRVVNGGHGTLSARTTVGGASTAADAFG